ncbi:MAG: cupin domain-containing protein [Flavobacteriales bacterium]|nr:cupin domain-containing protein [Flavobacteriales bacterium]
MNKIILMIGMLFMSVISMSQEIHNLIEYQPEEPSKNINVKKMYSDSLVTSFLIWVKESVRAHKHIEHTETLYVLEGEGKMIIGGSEVSIQPGDFFTIPKNTEHSLSVTSNEAVKVISVQTPVFNGKDRIFTE